LPPEQADALMGDAVSGDLRVRIAHAAGGNPLFISEMLAMAADDADVNVPPTLKALLAARLDQLDEAERRVLERGSVEGEIFHRGGVQALAPEETQVTTRLAALVRHQLVRPDRAQIDGDDGYRFRHLLIRDAAYDALPKAVRADLHARFADWLDEHGKALVEGDEIVGYHLEQAVRYHSELGKPDPQIADRAAARLGVAGRRALDRGDWAGGALLARAAELVRPHRLDLVLELETAYASFDLPAAVKTAEAAAERAEAEGDHSGATLGRASALFLRSHAGELDAVDEVIALCRAVLPDEEERADPRRLWLLWEMLGSAANFHQQHDDNVEAALQALRYRRLAGYPGAMADVEWVLIGGPRPVAEAMRLIDELAASRPPGSQDLSRAVFLAMLGNLDEARSLAEARTSHLREVTGTTPRLALRSLAMIEGIGGDRQRACQYRAAALEFVGSPIAAATEKGNLARELCYLGRVDEAEQLLDEARAVPSPGSGIRVMATAAEALLLARRGELEQAETLARTAVATAETRTDSVPWQAYTHEDLATVLERAGRTNDAREELERALAIWERKGCLPCADRIRAQIDSLGRTPV
jgi:tetratricopeptide (TPR) repeat protein